MIDQRIQPLLDRLWAEGIVTYQSCSGHVGSEGFPSAHIWLSNNSLSDTHIAELSRKLGIEQISRIWGREKEPVIEIVFAGETLRLFRTACREILRTVEFERQ